MIESLNLTKNYGDTSALDGVTFKTENGTLGVCGARGAGKSTLLAILADNLPATSGEIKVNEKVPSKRSTGYLMEENPLFPEMTVSEYLFFIGESKKIPYEKLYRQIKELLDLCDLDDAKDVPIANLKSGVKKMVGIAQTLLGNPDTIILDEPFFGMNQHEISTAKAIVKMLGEIKTVVISSSYPTDIADVCTELLLLSSGKVVACDTTEGLSSALCDLCALDLKIAKFNENTLELLGGLDGVSECILLPDSTSASLHAKLVYDGRAEMEQSVIDALSPVGAELTTATTSSVTLDDLCISLDNAKEEK